MLGIGKTVKRETESFAGKISAGPSFVKVFASGGILSDPSTRIELERQLPESQSVEVVAASGLFRVDSPFVLSLYLEPSQLDAIADAVLAQRQAGHKTTLIIAINTTQISALGRWLDARANAGKLSGTRLILANSVEGVGQQLPDRLTVVTEDNVIRMPVSPEIENTAYKNFFTFSPQLHKLAARIRGFAENGVTRAYLLGGPGAGKTSFAYYSGSCATRVDSCR